MCLTTAVILCSWCRGEGGGAIPSIDKRPRIAQAIHTEREMHPNKSQAAQIPGDTAGRTPRARGETESGSPFAAKKSAVKRLHAARRKTRPYTTTLFVSTKS